MDHSDTEARQDGQQRKEWTKPVLEVFPIPNTAYWKFDDSGDFPINVWVDDS